MLFIDLSIPKSSYRKSGCNITKFEIFMNFSNRNTEFSIADCFFHRGIEFSPGLVERTHRGTVFLTTITGVQRQIYSAGSHDIWLLFTGALNFNPFFHRVFTGLNSTGSLRQGCIYYRYIRGRNNNRFLHTNHYNSVRRSKK